MEDMCHERRRAEACVDESAHHTLVNAGGREIVGKKEGEQKVCVYYCKKGSVRGNRVCLLLPDLLQSCSRGGEKESGGHVP